MNVSEKEKALSVLRSFCALWDGSPETKDVVWNFPHECAAAPGFVFAGTEKAVIRIPKEMLPGDFEKYRGDAAPPKLDAALRAVWRDGVFSGAFNAKKIRTCRSCNGGGKVDAPGDKCMVCDGTGICVCPDCGAEHDCGCCGDEKFPGHIGCAKKDCPACSGDGVESVPMVGSIAVDADVRRGLLALVENFPGTMFMESALPHSGWPCALFKAGDIVGVVVGEKTWKSARFSLMTRWSARSSKAGRRRRGG